MFKIFKIKKSELVSNLPPPGSPLWITSSPITNLYLSDPPPPFFFDINFDTQQIFYRRSIP